MNGGRYFSKKVLKYDMDPESRILYKTLLDSPFPLSAKKLGEHMRIVPNTVYRLTNGLIKLGLITKEGRYPCSFKAKPISEGLSLFLLNQQNWFSETFGKNIAVSRSQDPSISFIQSRDELMRLSVGETGKATTSVDLLRSGHEIPADLMLAIRNSKERNVVTRMIIQDYGPENKEMVTHWKENGILVRITTLRNIRLMIYDKNTVYFMSYKHTDSEKDMGMKIEYPPLATIFSSLFNEWWKQARRI